MTRVIILQGPYLGRAIDVAPANAAAGKTDGWAVPFEDGYPIQTGNTNSKKPPPASYNAWATAGFPIVDEEPEGLRKKA